MLFYIYYVLLEICVLIGIYCGSTVFIEHVFIYLFTYLFIFIGSYFLLLTTCTIKFIEGKFYFDGRACYIRKTMPTCIE